MDDRLQALWDREQIRRCLLVYCRGADRNDAGLLRAAFHDDCLIEHGKFAGGPDDFVAWAAPLHASALTTQHCIMNITIDLDGDTAHAETYFMFTRMNPSGTPLTLAGGRYFDRLERRDDWRIAARITLRDWANLDRIPDTADQAAMTSTAASLTEADRRFMADVPRPRRGIDDPSYERPLINDPARAATYRALSGQTSKDTPMKAIIFNEFGGPGVLHVADLPDPVPGAGEVLVKVAATTVNPTDVMMRNGAQVKMMEGLEPPFIAGMEFSGTILDGGTSGLTTGTPVIGVLNPRTPKGGSYAQQIVVSEKSVAPLSTDVDLEAAATVPMNALTAALSLQFLDLEPGQTLLVTGGAGMLGGSAIQLAKAAGITVLANVSDKDAELVKGFGADHVLPRNDIDAALRAIAPEGVDGCIDGALIGNEVSHLVKDGGGIVSLRSSYVIEDPRLKVLNVSVLKGMEDTALMTQIADQISAGGLKPRVAETLSYRDAVRGHEMTEAGGKRGRVVLSFAE